MNVRTTADISAAAISADGTPSATVDRRKPKQRRGIQTYEAILESAAHLFARAGYDATTTHQVAARAGVSVGTLYRYFADKRAIFKFSSLTNLDK